MAELRIGTGSAWWGDRIEPARRNAESGDLDYLCFETMAEAALSAARVRKRHDPTFPGYDTYLDDRMRAALPGCVKRGTKIVSNQGWINPDGAARRIAEHCREHGRKGVRIAAVSGNVVTDQVIGLNGTVLEDGSPVSALRDTLVSAEAYWAPSRSSRRCGTAAAFGSSSPPITRSAARCSATPASS